MEVDILEVKKEKIKKPAKEKKAKMLRPRSTNSEGHYVPNSILLPEIIKCKETGIVTPELAKMFTQIATRYLSAKNFASYSYIKEDMIANAVYILCLNGLKFKLEYKPGAVPNPFSYVTQIVYHSSLQFIAAEKRQRDIRDQMLLDEGATASLGYMEKERDRYQEEHADLFRMKD
jgi:hypothetical protein